MNKYSNINTIYNRNFVIINNQNQITIVIIRFIVIYIQLVSILIIYSVSNISNSNIMNFSIISKFRDSFIQ